MVIISPIWCLWRGFLFVLEFYAIYRHDFQMYVYTWTHTVFIRIHFSQPFFFVFVTDSKTTVVPFSKVLTLWIPLVGTAILFIKLSAYRRRRTTKQPGWVMGDVRATSRPWLGILRRTRSRGSDAWSSNGPAVSKERSWSRGRPRLAIALDQD